jgi:hypothetical protein
MDLRLRLFRHGLGVLFRHAWSLLIQYDSKDLQYRFLEDSLQIDPVALHDEYQIEPRGGMDMVSKAMLINRAVQRKQLFMNSPWINQVELDKSILEIEDPALVPRLVQDPNEQVTDEAEDEQRIIPALVLGQIIVPKPGQNFEVRIGVLMQFLEQSRQTGMQLSPQGGQAITARLDALLNGMEQVDTNNARALRKDVQQYLQSIGLVPAQEDTEAALAAEISAQAGGPAAALVPEGQPPQTGGEIPPESIPAELAAAM